MLKTVRIGRILTSGIKCNSFLWLILFNLSKNSCHWLVFVIKKRKEKKKRSFEINGSTQPNQSNNLIDLTHLFTKSNFSPLHFDSPYHALSSMGFPCHIEMMYQGWGKCPATLGKTRTGLGFPTPPRIYLQKYKSSTTHLFPILISIFNFWIMLLYIYL